MSDGEYVVKLTKHARRAYEKFLEEAEACRKRADHSNARVKRLRLIDEAIERIIPAGPFDHDRALGFPLSNIFRIKKGRMRICYVGSSEQREIRVLYISETPRKGKDNQDPYAIFTRLVESGIYDEVFDELGIRRTPRRSKKTRVY